MYGNRSSISSAPFYAGLKRTEEEAIEQFSECSGWLLESFRVVELDKMLCLSGESASGYSAYHCKRDV